MEVERGTAPNVAIRWNETTDRWEYTEDGANWKELGEVNLDLGVQELTKYVAKENPDLVLQELNRGSSVDYEDLDLSGFIRRPPGRPGGGAPGDLLGRGAGQRGEHKVQKERLALRSAPGFHHLVGVERSGDACTAYR